MPYLKNGEPMCVLWVGNFFKPEYDDENAMRRALLETRDLGFNGIVLDSKQWRDFGEFFAGGEPSRYVAMQRFAISEAHKLGLSHMFLALYLCGDNLYSAGLRESPPILVDAPIGVDGAKLPTYRYWSPLTRESMITHIDGLLEYMGENHLELANAVRDKRFPMVTMFEPWVIPSFDADGAHRYISWLERRYGSIEAINRRYGWDYSSFSELRLEECWYASDKFTRYEGIPPFSFCPVGNTENQSSDFRKFVDNQLWRVSEYTNFFEFISRITREREIYSMPILNQWQMFFGSGVCWNNVSRAIDPWLTARFSDSCTFNTLPADMFARPDPYVVSVELSISRSASPTPDFVAGFDVCRFVEGDVYASVPPSEVFATAALHGAKGLHVYGYNGLDDGGSLKRMPEAFKRNVADGIAFFRRAAKATRGRSRAGDAAILYPLWMSLFQPYGDAERNEKTDFLGWYRYLCDLGYQVDLVHPDQVVNGILGRYRLLVIPYDPYYPYDLRPAMENAIRSWIADGGIVAHGSRCDVMRNVIEERASDANCDAVVDDAHMLAFAYRFESYDLGAPAARYRNGAVAATEIPLGEGRVLAVGFNPGLSYAQPRQVVDVGNLGNGELYQFCMFSSSFLSRFLLRNASPSFIGVRGVERALFDGVTIAVNHNPFRVDIAIDGVGPRTIEAHSGLCID